MSRTARDQPFRLSVARGENASATEMGRRLPIRLQTALAFAPGGVGARVPLQPAALYRRVIAAAGAGADRTGRSFGAPAVAERTVRSRGVIVDDDRKSAAVFPIAGMPVVCQARGERIRAEEGEDDRGNGES